MGKVSRSSYRDINVSTEPTKKLFPKPIGKLKKILKTSKGYLVCMRAECSDTLECLSPEGDIKFLSYIKYNSQFYHKDLVEVNNTLIKYLKIRITNE